MTRPAALLVSAYDARSHRRWADALTREVATWTWTTVRLPPRHFAWRVRGNALSLLDPRFDAPLSRRYELVVATSMTDLVALQSLRPALREVPSLLYFHENQFAYPRRADEAGAPSLADVELDGIKRALAATGVAFNSAFNRDSFLAGAEALLERMPDAVPDGLCDRIEGRSRVLPVPVEDACFAPARGPRSPGAPLTIVWNHRWEHDKAPERFVAALAIARRAGVPFRVHLLGERFREVPSALASARAELGDRLASDGFEDDAGRYRRRLAESDVVVSTALHDFQGLSVLDGIAAGCVPLVPDRLAYPEFVPERFRYASTPDDPDAEAEALARAIGALATAARSGELPAAPDLRHWAWSVLRPKWEALLERTRRAGAAAGPVL